MTNRGCHIEASWINLRDQMMPPGASDTQVADMRMMFFCGAVSLYDMIARLMKTKPNPNSAAFLQAIHVELEAFMAEQVGSERLDS